ncbi:type II secretion system protein [Virgibacillus halophilus]|uniref:Type II secretion system protein n=1 Tax=Tigheibacillus halophilus TaxID=361280 RepID=A0ABU5CBG3_9BACI|nr:type II secretion system protein [Virgibacillus halophilus]
MEAEKFQLRQNNISNGFTLLETIFVLGILSLFLVLAIPLSWTFLQKQQEKQFIDTLQSDLLLIQSLSAQEDDQIKIIFHETDYTVQTSRAKKRNSACLSPRMDASAKTLYNYFFFRMVRYGNLAPLNLKLMMPRS